MMLSALDKIWVLSAAAAVVSLTLITVVCIVVPYCPLHRLLPEKARIKYDRIAAGRGRKKSKNLEKFPKYLGPNEISHLNFNSYHNYGEKIAPSVDKIIPGSVTTTVQPAPTHATSNGAATAAANFTALISTPPARRPVALATSQDIDSTYSSMTPTGSRPSSPLSSKSDPQDISFDSQQSFPPSVDVSPVYGCVSIGIQFVCDENSAKGHLVISIQEAHDLPLRENGSYGDPYLKVWVTKQRRSLRRPRRSTKVLALFETNHHKKTRDPQFAQDFQVEINRIDLKDCSIRVAAYDRDKYTGPTACGESNIKLKETELTPGHPEPIQLCLELSEPTQYQGELLLGLMYLPTAERMSVSFGKVSHLRHQDVVSDIKSLNIHLKALLLHNGRMVEKKKTESHVGSADISFDESIVFDVPTEQLPNLSLVVAVVHREIVLDNKTPNDNDSLDSSGISKNEKYLGKVIIGPNSRSSTGHHWETALHRPREQVQRWHVLR